MVGKYTVKKLLKNLLPSTIKTKIAVESPDIILVMFVSFTQYWVSSVGPRYLSLSTTNSLKALLTQKIIINKEKSNFKFSVEMTAIKYSYLWRMLSKIVKKIILFNLVLDRVKYCGFKKLDSQKPRPAQNPCCMFVYRRGKEPYHKSR